MIQCIDFDVTVQIIDIALGGSAIIFLIFEEMHFNGIRWNNLIFHCVFIFHCN